MTEHDQGKGLVKTYWPNIRERVANVEPKFAAIVDKLNPNQSFPIFLAYYPYGAIEGDTQDTFLPKPNGGNYSLSDPDVPKDIFEHLGYGKESVPLGMVLEKNLELFIDLKEKEASIPWLVYKPGDFFPYARILNDKNARIYAPNGLLSATSGARSVFMLPNIGCAKNHVNLQRDFNIQLPPPKSLHDQWAIFKEIVNRLNCDWRSCVMYFSEKWVDKLQNDEAWLPLKLYLHERAWRFYEYERNRIYYDITFSVIQEKRNLKPNPYLVDTARHLFSTALGAVPGYAPACNDDALPIELLQKVYIDSYGLKKYAPTIFQPMHFNLETDTHPIYYSLKHPSTHVFSPKSRARINTLTEMRELDHIMKTFIEDLRNPNGICGDTIIGKAAKEVQFDYFHNELDPHNIIKPSTEAEKNDPRLQHPELQGAIFASDAQFVRGCVSIQTKS